MHTFENTFIRGPSPSYSDEVTTTSENAVMGAGTLALGDHLPSSVTDKYLNEKFGLHSAEFSAKQGRNTFAFWTVVVVLLVLTVSNLILTLTIIGVLHLGRGIHGMELIPEEDVIKFYGSTDLDRIYTKAGGQIDGFADVPVSITGDDGSVLFRLQRNGQIHNRLVVDKEGIQFRAVNTFEVKDPTSGATIFTTHRPHYVMPKGAEALIAKSVSASRITSHIGQPLQFEADGHVAIRGSEGIQFDAASILLQSEHNIAINSTQGATILEGGAGVFLDMDKIPIVSSEFGLRTGSVQYKICVCMPQGTLFRIAIPRVHNGPKISCAHFNAKHDPCAIN